MPATSKESQPRTKQSKKRSERDRRECIKRKTMELATLCDVKACAIISGADGSVETWPENPAEVKSLVKQCVEESSNRKGKAHPESKRENLDDLSRVKGKETEQDDNMPTEATNLSVPLHHQIGFSIDLESEIELLEEGNRAMEEGNRAMAEEIESFKKVAGEQNKVKGKGKEIQPPPPSMCPNPVRSVTEQSVDGTSGSFY